MTYSNIAAEAATYIAEDNNRNRLWEVESVRTYRNGDKLRDYHLVPGRSKDEAVSAVSGRGTEVVGVRELGHVQLVDSVEYVEQDDY